MRNSQDGDIAIEKQPTEENNFAMEDPPQPREMEGVQLIERSRTLGLDAYLGAPGTA